MFAKIKAWALRLRSEVIAVFIASKDKRTPTQIRVIALAVVAYACSPIDLIPDFIPVLGYLDDIIIVPLGIMLVVSMMPNDLMADYRARAAQVQWPKANWLMGAIIIGIWIVMALYLGAVIRNTLLGG